MMITWSRISPRDFISNMPGFLTESAKTSRLTVEPGISLCTESVSFWVRVVKLLTLCTEKSRSEEHTSELQSRRDLVCRLLLEKKKKKENNRTIHAESRNHNTHLDK